MQQTNYPVKVEGGICPNCGGKYVKSPKTGKIFCANKCWLNQTPMAQMQTIQVDKKGEEIKGMFDEKKQNIKWQGAKNKAVDIALAKLAELNGDEALQREIEKWANYLYSLEPEMEVEKIPF